MKNLSSYNYENEEFTRKELNAHDYPDENGMYPSLNELKRRASEARRQAEEEEIDYTVPDACPICRDGKYCYCGRLQDQYNDYNYNYESADDSCEYCPDCGTHFDQDYYIAEDHAVCGCSSLYPDLRPNDYPDSWVCSCDLVKYVYLDETICICNSPHLYALLERQHELNLTLNLVLIEPDTNKSENPHDVPFPFGGPP